jgi:hypothetical protein
MKSGELPKISIVSVAEVPNGVAPGEITVNNKVNGGCMVPNSGISNDWIIGSPPTS